MDPAILKQLLRWRPPHFTAAQLRQSWPAFKHEAADETRRAAPQIIVVLCIYDLQMPKTTNWLYVPDVLCLLLAALHYGHAAYQERRNQLWAKDYCRTYHEEDQTARVRKVQQHVRDNPTDWGSHGSKE